MGFAVEVRFAAERLAGVFFAVEVFFAALVFPPEDRFDGEAFFAPAFAGAFLVEVPFAPGPPRDVPGFAAVEPPRRVAEPTFRATFGAFSAIALPICGARLATWSPAARTALPTVGEVFDATLRATSGAFFLSVFAISGALSATALPTAGAFFAISPTRSPSMSVPFLFVMSRSLAR